MFDALADRWWILALQGVSAIIFGILAIVWPGITLGALVIVFGAYAIVDGAFALIAGISGETSDRWFYIIGGLAGITAGIVAWAWPGITAFALLYLIGAWAVFTGTAEIIAAISGGNLVAHQWMLIFSGAISILFGIILFAFPGDGAVALVITIGIFAVFMGVSLLMSALTLRGYQGGTVGHGAHA